MSSEAKNGRQCGALIDSKDEKWETSYGLATKWLVKGPLTMRRKTEGREFAEDEATGGLEETRAPPCAYEGMKLFLQSLQIASSLESDATAQCK